MTLSFEPCPDRYKKILVSLDGEFWKEIDDLLYQKIILEVKTFSQEEYDEIEKLVVKTLLYKKIARKSFFSKEIEDWMNDLGVSPSIQQNLISEFKQLGYLNDAEYLKNFIEYSLMNKRGIHWIKNKLFLKKIPVYQIEKALERYVNDDSQKEQMIQIMNTKFKEINLNDNKMISKVTHFLLRKGYSMNLIHEVLCVDNFL